MTTPERFRSQVVMIGHVALGFGHPVHIQSMTNTPTADVAATVAQSIRLIEAGSAFVRITVPTMKEADCLRDIKNNLTQAGYHVPLIADVHFKPEVAEYCARFVQKVRINPGNYADKKTFRTKDYTHAVYMAELERIAERLRPLLDVCKSHGTALRIGTNHGSLSDRILNRYGDTPEGMVESTMEFLRICTAYGFGQLVVSLKASNPLIMLEANRLLVKRMSEENLCFPLHLGVTEAGAGEDGRIKSALGIGTLLKEGIGDTIRVSLTEDPVKELPFAALLVGQCPVDASFKGLSHLPFKDISQRVLPCVALGASFENEGVWASLFKDNTSGLYERHDTSPDTVFTDTDATAQLFGEGLVSESVSTLSYSELHLKKESSPKVMVWHFVPGLNATEDLVKFRQNNPSTSVLLKVENKHTHFDAWLADASVWYGTLLLKGMVDGFYVSDKTPELKRVTEALFGIMQAARVRISKTEFISCPTCGRTSFDMEKTLAEVKAATGHLKGLKIAVMGCIVNGPGEMADADYGYVGNALGRVNLYRGKDAILKNILQETAIEALVALLKEDGKWFNK